MQWEHQSGGYYFYGNGQNQVTSKSGNVSKLGMVKVYQFVPVCVYTVLTFNEN